MPHVLHGNIGKFGLNLADMLMFQAEKILYGLSSSSFFFFLRFRVIVVCCVALLCCFLCILMTHD